LLPVIEHEGCATCGLWKCPQVPGAGPDRADVVIVGEAPGDREVEWGEPFVGRAGKLLNMLLEKAGLARHECYTTNAVLCRPVPHREPRADELRACRPRLLEETRARQPRIVVAMGNAALRSLLDRYTFATKISDYRGGIEWCEAVGAYMIPTYPPAALFRKPELIRDIMRDLRRVAQFLRDPAAVLPDPSIVTGIEYRVFRDRDELLGELGAVAPDRVAVDVETSSKDEVLSLALSWQPGRAWVLPRHLLADPVVVSALNRWLSERCLVGHNLKFDLRHLWRIGMRDLRTGLDSMLMHYTLDERQGVHGLKYLAREYLRAPDYEAEIAPYMKQGMETCPEELLYRYNAIDASCTIALVPVLEREMDNNARRVLRELLIPASDVLARMEETGIEVDVPYLQALEGQLSEELGKLAEQCRQAAGCDFNPASPKQVAQVLFDRLGLPAGPDRSTEEDELLRLKDLHPLPGLLLEYRDRQKFLSTYVRGLLARRDGQNRVHTTFNLHGTVTGRLSSSNPNLQNIGRNAEARNMFRATSEGGWTLVEGDMSQAEVRVLAYYSQDPALLEAIANTDVHTMTARLMFGRDDITKESPERQAAKHLTFGVIYGMSPQGLAEELGCSEDEAAELIRRWFSAFPKAREWILATQEQAVETACVSTPLGRVRRFGLVTWDAAPEVRRQAVNAPIQSLASDVTLKALIQMGRELWACDSTRLLLTVHDSILLETREDPREVAAWVKARMMQAAEWLGVPWDVEVKTGTKWGDMHVVED